MVKEENEDDKKIVYILTYLFGWLSGIIVYFTKGKEDSRIKLNAIQAILLGIISIIIAVILFPIALIVNIIIWAYGLYIGIKAYNMQDVNIPLISNYAIKHSGYTPIEDDKFIKKSTKKSKVDKQKEVDEEDALKTLRLRFVKGEITKKKYNEMKKALE